MTYVSLRSLCLSLIYFVKHLFLRPYVLAIHSMISTLPRCQTVGVLMDIGKRIKAILTKMGILILFHLDVAKLIRR